MKTWARHLGGYPVVALDYANLPDYIDDAALDFSTLHTLPLPTQKDAYLALVLNKHGGVFMDTDILATGNIAPVLARLRHSEMVLFSRHLAFVAARPGARLLARWRQGIHQRLRALQADSRGDLQRGWDFLGNALLSESMTELVGAAAWARTYQDFHQRRRAWRRLAEPFWSRRRFLVALPFYRKYVTMLGRKRHAFIAEAAHYGFSRLPATEQYQRFWFESDLPVSAVFRKRQRLIGLHNSWTPDWYKKLSEEEVLRHPCLLSRTLRHLLDGHCPTQTP